MEGNGSGERLLLPFGVAAKRFSLEISNVLRNVGLTGFYGVIW
jgi:hypothetical protein